MIKTARNFLDLFFLLNSFFTWVSDVDHLTAAAGIQTNNMRRFIPLRSFIPETETNLETKFTKVMDNYKGVILVNESNFPNVRSSLARQNKDNLLRAYSNRKYSLLQHYRRVALRKP